MNHFQPYCSQLHLTMSADLTGSPRDCNLHEMRCIEKAGKHLVSSLVPRPSRPVLIACSMQKRREKVSCVIHGTKIYSPELDKTKEWGRISKTFEGATVFLFLFLVYKFTFMAKAINVNYLASYLLSSYFYYVHQILPCKTF